MTPFTFVYTALKPPLRWGSRWPLHDGARTTIDVQPTDIRIALPGRRFEVAHRQLRRLWQRRPRKWRGRPVVGFWLFDQYGELAFVYMKHGDYESDAHLRDEEFTPAEPQREGWAPGDPAPAWSYVDPMDLADPARWSR